MAQHSPHSRPDLIAPFDAAIETCRRDLGEEGIQVAIYHQGALVLDAWDGIADVESGAPVHADTLFPIFSISKSISAFMLHLQAEKGLVDYAAPVAQYWPEFAAQGKGTITVQQVLDHQSGLYQLPEGTTAHDMCDFALMTRAIAAQPAMTPPGIENACMVLTYGWILGEIVRRTDPAGRDFATYLRDEITDPLGLDLWIGLPGSENHRVAEIIDSPRYTLPAGCPPALALPPHLASCRAIYGQPAFRAASIPGSNGLATARGVARLYALIGAGGALGGVRLLSEARVAGLHRTRPNTDVIDVVYGYPVRVGNGFWSGGNTADTNYGRTIGANLNAIGHPGSGGTIAWADPDKGIAVAICHNRQFAPAAKALDPIRDAITRAFDAP